MAGDDALSVKVLKQECSREVVSRISDASEKRVLPRVTICSAKNRFALRLTMLLPAAAVNSVSRVGSKDVGNDVQYRRSQESYIWSYLGRSPTTVGIQTLRMRRPPAGGLELRRRRPLSLLLRIAKGGVLSILFS